MANELPRHLDWLRRQKCAVDGCNVHQCEAHHRTHKRGMGQRSHDRYAIPLCAQHHRDIHNLKGYFSGWTRLERQAFHDSQLSRYQPSMVQEEVMGRGEVPIEDVF